MQHTFLPAAVLCLSGALLAQGTSIPPGYEGSDYGLDGNRYCNTLGAHADQRCQVVTGDTLPAGTWNKLSFKENAYTSTAGAARSFKLLQLQLGSHNYNSAGTVFASNFSATPTQVFSGPISFPTAGLDYNAVWGQFVAAGDMTIPFSQSYTHGGNTGTCIDFMFSGGTLANSGTWTGAVDYFVDGLYDNNSTKYNQAPAYLYGNTGATCYATGQSNYGYFVPFQRTYGVNDDSTTTQQGNMRLYWRANLLSANSPAIGVLSLGQAYLGPTAIPGSCQGLYLDLTGTYPFVLLPFMTDASGNFNGAATQNVHVSFNPAFAGVRIWTQAAYTDPVKGFEISMGGSTWGSMQAPVTKLRMFQANDANAGNPVGTEVANYLPIMKVE